MNKNKYLKRFLIIRRKLRFNAITNETRMVTHGLEFLLRDSMIHRNSN
jgi:hypothetical protein